jgi:hypothetical protein
MEITFAATKSRLGLASFAGDGGAVVSANPGPSWKAVQLT